MGLSDTRTDHHLDVVSSAATARRARASHVAPDNPAGVPFPLPRWTAVVASVGASPPRDGLPPVSAESASTSRTFEACSGFTRVTAHRLARRTYVHLVSPRLQQRRVPPPPPPVATQPFPHPPRGGLPPPGLFCLSCPTLTISNDPHPQGPEPAP